MGKTYTIDEIDKAWKTYKEDWCFKYLVQGKWKFSIEKPTDDHITAIRRVRFNDVIDFPAYIKKHMVIK